ncbi:MAG TPA: thioredoxin family protein [Longimicrobiaceae bacterium]|nr:thioredoxin family protein [Longimicrobiaceae bacterium]
MTELDYGACWRDAFSWQEYLHHQVQQHIALWQGVWTRARVPDAVLDEARGLGAGWKLLVISEDWCGDASNTVPVIAKLAEQVDGMEVRVVKRDDNLPLMDAFLTGTARSIPLVVVMDARHRVVGRWGPRPAELQAFVLREKAAGLRSAAEIYRDVRQWYARDRGESTLREILAVVAAAGGGSGENPGTG